MIDKCCNHDCNQGRDCPNHKEIDMLGMIKKLFGFGKKVETESVMSQRGAEIWNNEQQRTVAISEEHEVPALLEPAVKAPAPTKKKRAPAKKKPAVKKPK